MNNSTALTPDYYGSFHCLGTECEDTCCGGWNITIDRGAYDKYKSSNHPQLAPIFQQVIQQNPHCTDPQSQEYGIFKMTSGNFCPLLDEEKLCTIHKLLGEQSLANLCAIYPRHINRFSGQVEYSLTLACPEAARVALLHPDPIGFVTQEQSPELARRNQITRSFPPNGELPTEEIQIWNDLRFLSIAILQQRSVTIITRLMLLGLFLENIDQEMRKDGFHDLGALQPILAEYAACLPYAEKIQSQLFESAPNQQHKLNIIGGILTGSIANGAQKQLASCLLDALDILHGADNGEDNAAIIARYDAAYNDYYKPFYDEHEYIVENYLVSEAFRQFFPIMADSAMEAYRGLVCSYAVIRFILIGMAGKHRGLTEELVITLIRTFTQKSSHDRSYIPKLLSKLKEENSESLMHMMWLLREHDE